jgi:hypothetical protein
MECYIFRLELYWEKGKRMTGAVKSMLLEVIRLLAFPVLAAQS